MTTMRTRCANARCVQRPHLVKSDLLARQLFDAMQTLQVGIAEIVDHHHIVPGLEKLEHCVRTDVPYTAGDKYLLALGATNERL